MRLWRADAGRWALAMLAACAALLIAAPVAGASFGTGKITGTVEHESTPLEGAYVEVYDASNDEFVAVSATTATGAYEVTELPAGSYKVEFVPPPHSAYAAQYWEKMDSLANATAVVVKAGEATEGIDAKLTEGGKIAGSVTGPHGEEVPGVDVYAFNGEFDGEAVTEAGGKYTIEALTPGAYMVGFFPAANLNFVAQYYNGASSIVEAQTVAVEEGMTAAADVVLQIGGKIEGRVTSATTHAPLAGVVVEATDTHGPFGNEAETNANGEYTIIGLASGSYDVEFISLLAGGSGFIEASDNGVAVTQGSTTSGINASLTPNAPNDTASPVASGTPAVGQALSCSNGSWSGVSPISYAYQWSREGSSIGGSTGSTYVVQSADQGHGLACEVTATNSDGHSSAKSNTLNVPAAPPPAPPATPKVSFSTSTLVVFRGAARVRLSCTAAPCSGVIEVTQQIVVKHRKGKRTISRRETLILGKGVFSLAPGKSGTFVVHVTKTGMARLARARHHSVFAVLVGSVSGGKTARLAVEVSQTVRRR